MKNNKFYILLSLILIIIIFSCRSTPSSTSGGGENNLSFIFELKLEPGEIYVKDIIKDKVEGELCNFNPFYIASNMLSFNGWLEFEKRITLDKQYELARALFVDLPVFKTADDARVVVVGQYFDGGTNLIFIIDRVKLKEGKVPGCEYGIRYLTNSFSFKAENKETGEKKLLVSDKMISAQSSYGELFIPYPNGELVGTGSLNIDDIQPEAAKSDMELVNMMDTFIKDGRPENDEKIERMYKTLVNKKDQDPMISILAVMNYGLYKLKLREYDNAKKMFKLAKSKLSADADVSFKHAIDFEADFLCKMVQALESNDIKWLK
jgi:hypothetical protein